jgi:hypothetical protein
MLGKGAPDRRNATSSSSAVRNLGQPAARQQHMLAALMYGIWCRKSYMHLWCQLGMARMQMPSSGGASYWFAMAFAAKLSMTTPHASIQ